LDLVPDPSDLPGGRAILTAALGFSLLVRPQGRQVTITA
jgi:hypothetical protein